jgi:hypothetical protein
MKNLVLSTLIAAVASQAAGCIIFSDDDGSTPSDLGEIRLTWNLLTTKVNEQMNPDAPGACPAGADTAKLFALRAGDNPANAFSDAYDCIDGTGVLSDLEPGNYTVWVQITDHPGTTKFAESFSQDITVFAGNTTSTPVDIYVDRGFVGVGWQLTGRATSCAAVANGGVSIIATNSGGANAFDTVVDCAEGEGRETITQPIPSVGGAPGYTGTYTVAVQLRNNAGASIGDAPDTANVTVEYGNALKSIGIKQIAVR